MRVVRDRATLRRSPLLARLFGVVLALAFMPAAYAGGPTVADSTAPATPLATVQAFTEQALAVLRANQEALRTKPVGVATQIAGIVDPYVDFTIVSEEALGAGWRRADETQRARFVQAFHQLLTNDYAAVFKQYTSQTIKVTGGRWVDAAQNRAIVSSQIESPGAQPIQIDYHMYHTGGQWKVYDVVVDGVSLLINYREEFASELEQESVDALISKLEQKVASEKH